MYKGGVDYGYTAEDFEAQAEHVRAGDIVLIYSGYEPCRSADDPIQQTFVTPEAAQWLVDHGVRAVGCEPAGLEHGSKGYFEYRWYDARHAEPAVVAGAPDPARKRRVHHRGARQPRPSQGPAGTVRGASPERPRALRLPRASRCLDRALDGRTQRDHRLPPLRDHHLRRRPRARLLPRPLRHARCVSDRMVEPGGYVEKVDGIAGRACGSSTCRATASTSSCSSTSSRAASARAREPNDAGSAHLCFVTDDLDGRLRAARRARA